MRRGGPFVVSLRFNPVVSISFIVCAVRSDSVFAAADRELWCGGYRSLRALATMSRVCRGAAWQGGRARRGDAVSQALRPNWQRSARQNLRPDRHLCNRFVGRKESWDRKQHPGGQGIASFKSQEKQLWQCPERRVREYGVLSVTPRSPWPARLLRRLAPQLQCRLPSLIHLFLRISDGWI
jgi:hypothetical protein